MWVFFAENITTFGVIKDIWVFSGEDLFLWRVKIKNSIIRPDRNFHESKKKDNDLITMGSVLIKNRRERIENKNFNGFTSKNKSIFLTYVNNSI